MPYMFSVPLPEKGTTEFESKYPDICGNNK